MRTPPDLHPDDLAQRECLRDLLVDVRHIRDLSQSDLGYRMGLVGSTVTLMELRLQWRVSTVQRWADALGLRLVLSTGLPGTNEDVYLLRPADPAAALAFDRRAFIESLAEGRRQVQVTQRRLGEKLGISENGVAAIEKENDIMMANAQRYCRGLGSQLRIELEEVSPPWPA